MDEAKQVKNSINTSLHNASLHSPASKDHYKHVLSAIQSVKTFRSNYTPEHQDKIHSSLTNGLPNHPVTKLMSMSDKDLNTAESKYISGSKKPMAASNKTIWESHFTRQESLRGHLHTYDPQSEKAGHLKNAAAHAVP